ncbi:MAG: RNA-directed DNA polymerase [Rhodospirillaceae bacterium]|nr:RNA-directed DNA polymerase [Rhodospirillaceae bacterium]
MNINSAIKLSIANIMRDGLDDVLPTPFEINLLRTDTKLKNRLIALSNEKLSKCLNQAQSSNSFRDALDSLSLVPLSHVLVPKKEAFDFRKIAIIRPEDLALYQAVSIILGQPFEKERAKIARGRIYSYRFKPHFSEGRLFSREHHFRKFQHKTAQLCRQASVKYIVKGDIANFYDRINIHRIESTLLAMPNVEDQFVKLMNQILLHWARRDSYGLPIGSNASRILAEVALYTVDRSLVEAGIKFIRYVDDYRIFTNTATEAHASLARLMELLNREGLFINAKKSSIRRLDIADIEKFNSHRKEVQAQKIRVREFTIIGGYGGDIPIKFRKPTESSQRKYSTFNLTESLNEIKKNDFAQPEQLRDVLFTIIVQEKFHRLIDAYELVEMFPQFFPFFTDMLIKNSEHIPTDIKNEIISTFSKKIMSGEYFPEFLEASLIKLLGHEHFFDRNTILHVVRNQRRNAGSYLGRTTFDAVQNLNQRGDALDMRDYFDRSNEWERRRIIKLMSKVLPKQEYLAWRRAIRPYISKDPFALAIK